MSSISLRRIKTAMNKLEQQYKKGIIGYPRVDTDYKESIDFNLSAHPKIGNFDGFSHLPLSEDSYPLTLDTVPLELSNNGISTPATTISIMEKVDEYFTNDKEKKTLMVKKEKEEELKDKLTLFYGYIDTLFVKNKKKITTEEGNIDINKITKDGYVAEKRPDIYIYRIKLEPTPSRKQKIDNNKTSPKKRKREDLKNFSSIKPIEVNNFYSALVDFKKKINILKFIKDQKDKFITKIKDIKSEYFKKRREKKEQENNSKRDR